MFCSKCGNQIPEGAAFCSVCGTAVTQPAPSAQPAVQPVVQPPVQPVMQPLVQPQAAAQPAKPNVAVEVLKDFLKVVKGVFSKDAVKTVSSEAQSSGFEWIVMLGLWMVTFILSLAVNIQQMLGAAADYIDIFGKAILANWAIAVVAGAATVFGIYGLLKVLFQKDVHLMAVLNMVGTAMLPLTAAYLINMLLGLIWVPLVTIVSFTALFMTIVLLYVGIQKLAKLDKSPFYAFHLLMGVVVFITVVVSYLCYKSVFSSAVSSMFGSLNNLF